MTNTLPLFCPGPLREQVVKILTEHLFIGKDAGWLPKVYRAMAEHFADPNGFALDILEAGDTVFGEFLSGKEAVSELGIDLPVWFGDPDKAEQRLMVVAMDPKRAGQKQRGITGITLNSVFSLHSRPNGRETGRNDYWRFIEPLTNHNLVYLTDVYKLYYDTVALKEGRTYGVVSNKDESFIGRKTAPYQMNKAILAKEIKEVRPTRIVTFGNEAASALKSIHKISGSGVEQHKDGIHYIFMPHISRTVTQSITTIANLYITAGILRGNDELERIGKAILAQRPALYGEG